MVISSKVSLNFNWNRYIQPGENVSIKEAKKKIIILGNKSNINFDLIIKMLLEI